MIDVTRIGPHTPPEKAAEQFVRMRDGVRLATDVYLPEGDASPGDTILTRLPYDKRGIYTFMPLVADYFMSRGYRVVVQDVRGKFRSEGDALFAVNEADDGYDTIEWITHQPWSNGKVAMWGDSYYGYTQYAAMTAQHPALKAIAPRVTGTGLGEPVHLGTGQPTREVELPITYLYPLTFFHTNDVLMWEMDWAARPFSAQAEAVMDTVGERSISYDQWYPRPVYLPRFPTGDPFAARPVPLLNTIGWWDNCAPESWADEAALAEHPEWQPYHYVRIEPIDHENHQLSAAGDVAPTVTPELLISEMPRYLDPALEFFEVFVRGNGSPADIPKVRWAVGGTDEWRDGDVWPPRDSRPVDLFAAADGSLSATAQADERAVQWVHDPDAPVPSSTRDAFGYLATRLDEAGLGEREDVLLFRTEPLAESVTFAGPVAATVTAWSDGPTMAVFVRVYDEAPDGTALRIARGQIHVEDASAPQELVIGMDHMGYRLERGHRLRVHVCSSDFPEFMCEVGTGEDPWSATRTCTNRHSILVGGPQGLVLHTTVLEGSL